MLEMLENLENRLSEICDAFEEAEKEKDFDLMEKLKIEADEIKEKIDTELF